MAKQPIILCLICAFAVILVGVSCQEFGQRLNEMFDKICKEEKIDEAKLQAIGLCRFKSLTTDYTLIRDCEKKVFGEDKTLDDLRKDTCRATSKERQERTRSLRLCLMNNETVKAKMTEMAQSMQGMTDAEKSRTIDDKRQAFITCMEQAYAA